MTLLPIDKARRATLIDGLQRLEYGFARDLVTELEDTRCPACGGGGYEPYVGGDDDVKCHLCRGSGFRGNALRDWIVLVEVEPLNERRYMHASCPEDRHPMWMVPLDDSERPREQECPSCIRTLPVVLLPST